MSEPSYMDVINILYNIDKISASVMLYIQFFTRMFDYLFNLFAFVSEITKEMSHAEVGIVAVLCPPYTRILEGQFI